MKKKIVKRRTRAIESFAILNYKKGQTFYTYKSDKDITAIANYYKKPVKTERLVAIDCLSHSKIELITKVTLI